MGGWFRRAGVAAAAAMILGGAAFPGDPHRVQAAASPAVPAASGARRSPEAAAQAGCPASDKPAGTVAWVFTPREAQAASAAPAIAADGTLYYGTKAGVVYAVTCQGSLRWRFDYAEHNAFGFRAQSFEGSPALGDDGTVFIGDDVVVPNFFFALNAIDGSPQWVHEEFGVASQIDVSPGITRSGHVFAASHGISRSEETGSILAFDQRGFLLDGFPIAVTGGVTSSPAVLSDDRVVMVSNGSERTVFGNVPTATRFAVPSSLPPPSPTPSATGSPARTRTSTPTGSPTRTRTPGPGSPTATHTGPPRVTPSATHTGPPTQGVPPAIFLPKLSNRVARGSAEVAMPAPDQGTATLIPTSTPRRTATFGIPSSSATPGIPRQIPTAPSQTTIKLQARLHVLNLDGEMQAVDVGNGKTSAVAATGAMVVFQVQDAPARLTAFDLAEPPRKLWDHFMAGNIVGAPLLGREDAAAGTIELYYADNLGTLVSLSVPTRAGDGARPTLRWARTLPAAVTGAPVLGDAGVLYAGVGRDLRAFRRADGSDAWSRNIAEDAIVGALQLAPGGMLYAGMASGRLFAIATESGGPAPDDRWPTFRHDTRNTGRAAP